MKVLHISAKCSDLCFVRLVEDSKTIGEHDGYVPNWFPNPNEEHFGDYVQLQIDVKTGQILNWKQPSQAALKATFAAGAAPE